MTQEQIKAINDAMSTLANLLGITDFTRLCETMAGHQEALLNAEVDIEIIKHFETLVLLHIHYVEQEFYNADDWEYRMTSQHGWEADDI